jgi:RecA-family ATPase
MSRIEDRAAQMATLINTEAEQALLGAIFIRNDVFDRVAGFLCPEHFGNAVHGRIFAAAACLIGTGTVANPVTLKNLFDQDGALTEIGGAQYLARLAGAAVTVINAKDYAGVIFDLAKRRDIIAAAQEAMDQAYAVDLDQSGADIAACLVNRMDELGRGGRDRLFGIDPRTLEGLPVPKRRFVVTPWIPIGRATGLYGAGGIGKTTLMQMLCTSTALDPVKFPNANWLGLPVRRSRSVLLFCEDDCDEMHSRQEEINRSYGCTFDDLGDMLWLPRLGTDNTLMTFENGRAARTPFFHDLLAIIKGHRAELAVWDTLTDVFGGSEIDRGQARRFVQEGPAYVAREIDGAVICCAHPSLSGISSGTGTSGSTGWDGAFRSRLYLSSPTDDDSGEAPDTNERVLTRMKANWAKIGETIQMRWCDGVFIADQAAGGIIGSIERRTADRVFADMLDKVTAENQPVSSNSRAGNYAPRLFAKRPDRDGFKAMDFEGAMQRLFAQGAIRNVPYGRKGDERTRIAAVPVSD